MQINVTEQFCATAQTNPVDPSVQYAEALMNGDDAVTVTMPDGQKITYQIGREYNCGQ